MAHDPSFPLQKALFDRLVATVPGVAGRVYDRPPMSAVFPYIQIGHSQTLPNSAACIDGAICNITLHVWSRTGGAVECRSLSNVIVTALDGWLPDLGVDLACADLRCGSALVMTDPDGLTTHAVMAITAYTQLI